MKPLGYFILGLLLGVFCLRGLEAQAARVLFGSSSTTGTAVVIQTDGSNSLKVLGK